MDAMLEAFVHEHDGDGLIVSEVVRQRKRLGNPTLAVLVGVELYLSRLIACLVPSCRESQCPSCPLFTERRSTEAAQLH